MTDPQSVEMTAIVPILNEEENLEEVYSRITKVLDDCCSVHEIIFVDDGSRDRSFQIMQDLHQRDPRVKIIKFSRNFGQHPAISAALRIARGKRVVCIDGDLQFPPEEIPKLVAKSDEGYEVVYGNRVKRRDPLMRRFGSWALSKLLELTPLAKAMSKDLTFSATTSSFRLLTRDVVSTLNRFEERARFLVVMTVWMGFKSAAVPVEHLPRERGESKYGLLKLILMTLDSLTGATSLPLRFASVAGTLLSALSLSYALFLVMGRLAFGWTGSHSELAWVLLLVAFLGGMQLLFLGIMGEYIARIYKEVQGRPLFVVDRLVGSGEGDLERLTHSMDTGRPYAGARPTEQTDE